MAVFIVQKQIMLMMKFDKEHQKFSIPVGRIEAQTGRKWATKCSQTQSILKNGMNQWASQSQHTKDET